jgi:hypothetical protein
MAKPQVYLANRLSLRLNQWLQVSQDGIKMHELHIHLVTWLVQCLLPSCQVHFWHID